MAVGGALRAALRAGRLNVAGRESRRQSRAMRSLNEGLGSQRRLPLEERGFERMSGLGYGETPRGNAVVFDPATGRRTVMPQSFDDFMEGRPTRRGPIEAPYEGVRTWEDPVGFGPQSFDAPPPWMGRGAPPPSRSFLAFDDGMSEYPRAFNPNYGIGGSPGNFRVFEPYGNSMNTNPANFNFMRGGVPSAFGGLPSPLPAPPVAQSRPRFFFDDITGVDSFIDPQTGFRYTPRGMPLD